MQMHITQLCIKGQPPWCNDALCVILWQLGFHDLPWRPYASVVSYSSWPTLAWHHWVFHIMHDAHMLYSAMASACSSNVSSRLMMPHMLRRRAAVVQPQHIVLATFPRNVAGPAAGAVQHTAAAQPLRQLISLAALLPHAVQMLDCTAAPYYLTGSAFASSRLAQMLKVQLQSGSRRSPR